MFVPMTFRDRERLDAKGQIFGRSPWLCLYGFTYNDQKWHGKAGGRSMFLGGQHALMPSQNLLG